MKIHFCDLCNESVPEGDLSNGKAFLRKGRVVCATCESSMGGGEAQPVGGDAPDSSKAPPRSSPSAPASSTLVQVPRKGGGRLVGTLALLLVLLLAAYVGSELQDLRDEQRHQQTLMEGRLQRMGSDLDDVSRRARDRDLGLEVELGEGLSAVRVDSADEMSAVRAELAREVTRLDELRQELSTLQTGLRESDEENGKRLDELFGQASQTRDRLTTLDDRLRGTELAIASGSGSAPVGIPTPAAAPPKYTAELADLASDNAGTRWNAVQALGETGDPEVIAHLVPVLDDSDVFVRMAVARVLGDLAAPEAIEPLINALEDEEAVVREAAMVALHGITGRNFRFDPVGTSADRAKKVKAWRSWWKKAREEYFGES